MGSVTVLQQKGLGEGKIEKVGFKVFGGHLKKDFPFAPGWRNLNQGECLIESRYSCFITRSNHVTHIYMR